MLTTLALVLASSAQATLVPANLGDNQWIVEAEVAGKRGRFQIGTNFRETVISDTFLESKPREWVFKIGDWQSVAVNVVFSNELAARGIDGFLGDNCFQNSSIAFDNVNRRLSVQSEPGNLSSWLQTDSREVQWIPLAQNDENQPLFSGSVAGTKIVAALTSGIQFSRVDPDIVSKACIKKLGHAKSFELDTKSEVTRDTGFLMDFSVDNVTFPPTRVDFRTAEEELDVAPIAIVPDALGDKVVLDYKNRRLGITNLSSERYATLLWRNIFHWSVDSVGGKLIVPERCRYLGKTQVTKAEVLEVGELKSSDLLKRLMASRSFQDISSYVELADTRYPVLFRTSIGLNRLNIKIDRAK